MVVPTSASSIIISFFIFCVVLFLYLHIQYQLKTGEDLEIYELDQPSKETLEDVCNLRQPVLFDIDSQETERIINTTNRDYLCAHYDAFDVQIRNLKDTDEIIKSIELYTSLNLKIARKVLTEDKTRSYVSENNGDFLEETGVIKNMKYNDESLRPYMVSNNKYDVIMASNGATTPFKYELNYRNYFMLTQGKATLKISPPHSSKYLYPKYDYDNFEFRSPIDVWNVQHKYSADFSKVKCLEFPLIVGKVLYLPAYWWYSIKLEDNASISCFYYRTYMNTLAISPHISLHFLQLLNTKRELVKKYPIMNLHKETNTTTTTPTTSTEENQRVKKEAELITQTDTSNESTNVKVDAFVPEPNDTMDTTNVVMVSASN